jgi:hypothetical protein
MPQEQPETSLEIMHAQGANHPDVVVAAKRVLVTMESALSLLRAMQMDEHLYAQEALSKRTR